MSGLATVIPLFPPGVHDIVTEDTAIESIKRVSCSMGDMDPIYAHESGLRWARSAAYAHAAEHHGERRDIDEGDDV